MSEKAQLYFEKWLPMVALGILSLFLFVSFSISAGYHILLIIPCLVLVKDLKLSKSAWCLIAFVAIGIISVLVNDVPKPVKNISKLKYYLIAVLSIAPLSIYWRKHATEIAKKRLIYFFLFSTSLATVSGLIGLWSGFNPLRFKQACHETRACGMYGMYMTYGYGISLFCLLLIGSFFKKLVDKRILILVLVINLAGAYLSAARGGWLGLMAGIPFVWYFSNKKAFIGVIVASIILGLGAFAFVPKVKKTFSSNSRIESIRIRITQYKAALYAFKSSPVLGLGFKNFEPQSTEIKKQHNLGYTHFGGHAHNNFLEVLASTGALGLLAILLFHFFWLTEILARNDGWEVVLLPFFVGFVVSGLFQNTFVDGENLFLIMTVYTLSQIHRGNQDAASV
jgi:O-antigen ligase